MKISKKLKSFIRYEGRLLLITIILITITGCITWNTFFKTPAEAQIRRDYLIDDVAKELSLDPKRLNKFSDTQLEIISRLDLNGLIALERYPEATERVYSELQNFDLFYQIVDEFGPQHTIPVLDYFYDDGNWAISLEQNLSELIANVFNKPVENDSLSPRQKRLLMILSEIQYQKHIFLVRFIYTDQGVTRNYVSSTTSTIVNFFTGGLSNFNEAVVTKGITHVSTAELIDAGIDILVIIPFAAWFSKSAKSGSAVMKGGRAVAIVENSAVRQGSRAAVKATRFGRIARFSKGVWKTIPLRTLFRFRYVKWYVLALAIAKPSLINHAAALLGKAISVPPIIAKTGFWFLILFPLLNLLTPLFFLFRFLWRKFYPKGKFAN